MDTRPLETLKEAVDRVCAGNGRTAEFQYHEAFLGQTLLVVELRRRPRIIEGQIVAARPRQPPQPPPQGQPPRPQLGNEADIFDLMAEFQNSAANP